MSDNTEIPFIVTAAGVAAMGLGFLRRSRARYLRALPCRQIAALTGDERQFISGKAHSPTVVAAPLSKASCVFYTETIDQRPVSGGRRSCWERVANSAYGGFFVTDASGTALVVPPFGSLDLRKPEVTESEDLILIKYSVPTQKAERSIAQDEQVTVLGTPRSLGEFMEYLRQDQLMSVHPDLITELLRLEKEGSKIPCFFGDHVKKLSDQPYGDYVSGGEASASFLLQTGAALTAAGGAALLYVLDYFGKSGR